MSTNFPNNLDSYTPKQDNVDDVLAEHINDIQDAVSALQVKVGTNGSAVITTLDYILRNPSSLNPGHKHDLTGLSIGYTPENLANKNQPSGYAGLTTAGKVPSSLLPGITLNTVYVVTSEGAMLALSAQQGDIAIRTDETKTYVLSSNQPSQLADWIQLLFPAGEASLIVNVPAGNITSTNVQDALNELDGLISASGASLWSESGNVISPTSVNHNFRIGKHSAFGAQSQVDKVYLGSIDVSAIATFEEFFTSFTKPIIGQATLVMGVPTGDVSVDITGASHNVSVAGEYDFSSLVGCDVSVNTDSTGTIGYMAASRANTRINSAATVTLALGMHIPTPTVNSGASVTTLVGLLIGDWSDNVATTKYNILSQGATSVNMFEGNVTVGSFKMATGAGAGSFFKSDASGNASWALLTADDIPSGIAVAKITGAEQTANKGQANGYAGLNADSEVTAKINTTAFKLTTGAGAGKVLKSDSDGVGSWGTESSSIIQAVTSAISTSFNTIVFNGNDYFYNTVSSASSLCINRNKLLGNVLVSDSGVGTSENWMLGSGYTENPTSIGYSGGYLYATINSSPGKILLRITESDKSIDEMTTIDSPLKTADSYSESNVTTGINMALGLSVRGFGQTFEVTDEESVVKVKFYLKKTGNPTGSVYVYIWNMAGTHGTNGIPTGSNIQSTTIDPTTLTTDYQLVEFEFSLTNGVLRNPLKAGYYCVTVEYLSGNSSNYVTVGVDTVTLGHAGNAISYNGNTYSAVATADTAFYVETRAGLNKKTEIITNGDYMYMYHPTSEMKTIYKFLISGTSVSYDSSIVLPDKLYGRPYINDDNIWFNTSFSATNLNRYTQYKTELDGTEVSSFYNIHITSHTKGYFEYGGVIYNAELLVPVDQI